MVYLYDNNTGEEVIREMNDAEYAQLQLDKASAAEEAAKRAEEDAQVAAKKAAKEEALAALGLSQEVINLLAD
jgi:sRNA-binding protein